MRKSLCRYTVADHEPPRNYIRPPTHNKLINITNSNHNPFSHPEYSHLVGRDKNHRHTVSSPNMLAFQDKTKVGGFQAVFQERVGERKVCDGNYANKDKDNRNRMGFHDDYCHGPQVQSNRPTTRGQSLGASRVTLLIYTNSANSHSRRNTENIEQSMILSKAGSKPAPQANKMCSPTAEYVLASGCHTQPSSKYSSSCQHKLSMKQLKKSSTPSQLLFEPSNTLTNQQPQFIEQLRHKLGDYHRYFSQQISSNQSQIESLQQKIRQLEHNLQKKEEQIKKVNYQVQKLSAALNDCLSAQMEGYHMQTRINDKLCAIGAQMPKSVVGCNLPAQDMLAIVKHVSAVVKLMLDFSESYKTPTEEQQTLKLTLNQKLLQETAQFFSPSALQQSATYFLRTEQLHNMDRIRQLFQNRKYQPVRCYIDSQNQLKYEDTNTLVFDKRGDTIKLSEEEKRYYLDRGYITYTRGK